MAKILQDCMEYLRHPMSKTRQLKQFVYALFTQNENQRLMFVRKSLIINVDQPGLEPGTSRFRVR